MIKDEKLLFEELNEKLQQKRLDLTLICVGGFVLDYYGIRGTMDIDAFYDESQPIHDLIYEIGKAHNLNTPEELWINNSVQNLNTKPPEEICKTIYEFSNLKVLIPPLDYVAGMKLISGRENDIEDVAQIIKHLNINDIYEFKRKLKSYEFGDADDALIIESFGIAYGMKWLTDYYIKNEQEVINSIENNHATANRPPKNSESIEIPKRF